MSKSDVPLAATGDWIDAAWVNQYIRDNIAAIWVGTTAGDMDYYSSAIAKTRVPIGGAGSILQSNGSVPSWLGIGAAGSILQSNGSVPSWLGIGAAPYYVLGVGGAGNVPNWRPMFQRCVLTKSADQTFASGSTADVIWETEIYDLGWHTGSGAEITPIVTGVYIPLVSLYFNKNSGGSGDFTITGKVLNNGAETPNKMTTWWAVDAVTKIFTFGGIPMSVTGGQPTKVTFNQDSGGDGKLINGAANCNFTLLRIE